MTITLLEITAARRGEVAPITVLAVKEASRMDTPMLRVITLKRRGPHERLIPIPRADLAFLLRYIDVYRRLAMKRVASSAVDHGVLLISDTTGEPLHAESITKEIKMLAAAAGITERACPHMFRHRRITKLIVSLIEQHAVQNPDQFRRLMIDNEAIKRKVAEWSGHASLASLDQYIDLAFEEIASFRQVFDLVHVGLAVDSFISILRADEAALRSGESASEVLGRLLESAVALRADLEYSRRPQTVAC